MEDRLRGVAGDYANVDGIVAVAHTEGGGSEKPNNLEFVLRTLSGFMVHPNVGAVLAVDYGTETVTNARVRDYMAAHGYPLTCGTTFSALRDGFRTTWNAAKN